MVLEGILDCMESVWDNTTVARQCCKIGFGGLCVGVASRAYALSVVTKNNLQEAYNRTITGEVDSDAIIEAYKKIRDFPMENSGDLFAPLTLIIGAGLIASGIYRLAKE
ncbi:MAG: hypothetical protein ABIF88_00990 [archaeon]